MQKCKKKDNSIKRNKKAPNIEYGSGNIFKDLGFKNNEAISLLTRAKLMIQLREIIRKNDWTQREAAKKMGVVQPRIAEIMKLRTDHWSIDQLLKYLDKLGKRVSFIIESKEVA